MIIKGELAEFAAYLQGLFDHTVEEAFILGLVGIKGEMCPVASWCSVIDPFAVGLDTNPRSKLVINYLNHVSTILHTVSITCFTNIACHSASLQSKPASSLSLINVALISPPSLDTCELSG